MKTARRTSRAATLLLCLGPAAAGAAVQACIAPPPGAVYWLAAERNFDDSAGYHNGSDAGTGVTFVAGKVGSAIHLDGAATRVYPDVTYAEERALRTAFTVEFWANPTSAMPSCAEATDGICGAAMPWAVFPENGDNSGGGNAAGIGVAVGTNGVCVGQHAALLLHCLARYDTPISDWVHVAVVVENKTPRIYLNGAPVHTGLASLKTFVFASWSVIGDIGITGYGGLAGDLDEVTVYNRALGDAEIAALFAAGGAGKCTPECVAERTDDLWQNAIVTDHTPLVSSDARGMFGATDSSPEPNTTIFADGSPDGTVHSVTWQTAAPVTLGRLGIAAMQDDANTTQRAFRHVRITARELGGDFATIYDSAVLAPYAQGALQRDLLHCPRIRPVHAQEFHAEFEQNGEGSFWGPRVVELDGLIHDPIFADNFDTIPPEVP
jgi:Concanavalin A-like lectin/glucanases superfamily